MRYCTQIHSLEQAIMSHLLATPSSNGNNHLNLLEQKTSEHREPTVPTLDCLISVERKNHLRGSPSCAQSPACVFSPPHIPHSSPTASLKDADKPSEQPRLETVPTSDEGFASFPSVSIKSRTTSWQTQPTHDGAQGRGYNRRAEAAIQFS